MSKKNKKELLHKVTTYKATADTQLPDKMISLSTQGFTETNYECVTLPSDRYNPTCLNVYEVEGERVEDELSLLTEEVRELPRSKIYEITRTHYQQIVKVSGFDNIFNIMDDKSPQKTKRLQIVELDKFLTLNSQLNFSPEYIYNEFVKPESVRNEIHSFFDSLRNRYEEKQKI